MLTRAQVSPEVLREYRVRFVDLDGLDWVGDQMTPSQKAAIGARITTLLREETVRHATAFARREGLTPATDVVALPFAGDLTRDASGSVWLTFWLALGPNLLRLGGPPAAVERAEVERRTVPRRLTKEEKATLTAALGFENKCLEYKFCDGQRVRVH